jgi:mannose-6-phosphate isomerase-like protein (cupin superfamily)
MCDCGDAMILKKVSRVFVRERQAQNATLSDAFLQESTSPLSDHAAVLASLSPKNAREGRKQALLNRALRTHRFPEFEDCIAFLAEISHEAARDLLLRIDAQASWEAGPIPGIALFHFSGGPSVHNAITGFVRLEKEGTAFPSHEHVGAETVVILQGAMRDDDGTLHTAGDQIDMPAGSAHAFVSEGSVPLVYLAIVQDAVIIAGHRINAGDPRA